MFLSILPAPNEWNSKLLAFVTSSLPEKYNALALIYWPYDSQSIKLNLYSYDLNLLKESASISEEISVVSGIGDGFFFKSCYLILISLLKKIYLFLFISEKCKYI